MSRFIAVIHAWHVDSKGFQVHELKGDNRSACEGEASLLAMRNQGTCRNADYCLVEISDRELIARRVLSWRERLTGILEIDQ